MASVYDESIRTEVTIRKLNCALKKMIDGANNRVIAQILIIRRDARSPKGQALYAKY
jgi:hypothetical protein